MLFKVIALMKHFHIIARGYELVKASVKLEVCHNNIIIEHRSFRWIEVSTFRQDDDFAR